MKLGIMPAFDRNTITDPDWVVAFLELAEEGGCDSVWAVEHVIVAEDYEPLYPYSPDGSMPGPPDTAMPDPLEWLSFAAAVTKTLLLGTSVVVASQHSAAILAKRVATLDGLSKGRVRLGVGLGWQKEEYAAIGVPYERRGARLDECIEAMRALWQDGPASYDGDFVAFSKVHSVPKPVQPTTSKPTSKPPRNPPSRNKPKAKSSTPKLWTDPETQEASYKKLFAPQLESQRGDLTR